MSGLNSTENLSFQDYANFLDKEKTPDLPFPNLEDTKKIDMAHGAYSSVISLGGGNVAKIGRLLELHQPQNDINELDTKVKAQDQEAKKYLAPKNEDSSLNEEQKQEINRKNVIERLTNWSKERNETYQMLKEYLGDFLPKLKFSIITESPRRVLEYKNPRNSSVTTRTLENVPISEIALVEIWEDANTKDSLTNMEYATLNEIYAMPEYIQQAQEFANVSYKLMQEKRTYLDICDKGGGIRGIDSTNKRIQIKNLNDIQRAEENKTNIYPRNVSISEGKLKYFDTYPVHEIPEILTNEIIKQVSNFIKNHDFKSIGDLENLVTTNKEESNDFRMLVRYLYLLKQMGAQELN